MQASLFLTGAPAAQLSQDSYRRCWARRRTPRVGSANGLTIAARYSESVRGRVELDHHIVVVIAIVSKSRPDCPLCTSSAEARRALVLHPAPGRYPYSAPGAPRQRFWRGVLVGQPGIMRILLHKHPRHRVLHIAKGSYGAFVIIIATRKPTGTRDGVGALHPMHKVEEITGDKNGQHRTRLLRVNPHLIDMSRIEPPAPKEGHRGAPDEQQ